MLVLSIAGCAAWTRGRGVLRLPGASQLVPAAAGAPGRTCCPGRGVPASAPASSPGRLQPSGNVLVLQGLPHAFTIIHFVSTIRPLFMNQR